MVMEAHLPNGKVIGKPRAQWLGSLAEGDNPVLLMSDAQHYLLMSYTDAEQCSTPWREAAERDGFSSIRNIGDVEDLTGLLPDDTSTLDDTFSFKHAR